MARPQGLIPGPRSPAKGTPGVSRANPLSLPLRSCSPALALPRRRRGGDASLWPLHTRCRCRYREPAAVAPSATRPSPRTSRSAPADRHGRLETPHDRDPRRAVQPSQEAINSTREGSAGAPRRLLLGRPCRPGGPEPRGLGRQHLAAGQCPGRRPPPPRNKSPVPPPLPAEPGARAAERARRLTQPTAATDSPGRPTQRCPRASSAQSGRCRRPPDRRQQPPRRLNAIAGSGGGGGSGGTDTAPRAHPRRQRGGG